MKELYLLITINLIILHEEKHHFQCKALRFSVKSVALFIKLGFSVKNIELFTEKCEKHNAFHTKDHLQGIVTCYDMNKTFFVVFE